MHKRISVIVAGCVLAVAGTAVALTFGGPGGEHPATPEVTAPTPPEVIPATSAPAAPSASATSSPEATPGPPRSAPPNAAYAGGQGGSGRSDADLANVAPINARPQGQVTGPGIIPQPGTKTGNTGPADEPVTTPTPLPNPAASPTPYPPSTQPTALAPPAR